MADKQNYLTYTDNTSDNNDKTMENLHKQIIVDNVDVSGCECYSVHREGYCGWFTPCEGDSCQYKLEWALEQLKRKEQECEELKKRVKGEIHLGNRYKEDFVEQFNEAEKLKAENEELKKEKRNFRNFLTNKYNYGSFRPVWGAYLLKRFFKEDLGDFFDEKAYEMADTIEEKEKQLDKYSQAFIEIKEIAEENIRIADLEGLNGVYRRGLAKQILQKISEVIKGY